jgi:mannose-6-phosphate isomerase
MEMPQEEVNRILEPLVRNIEEIYRDADPEKDDEDYWVARAAKLFCQPRHLDRGIFSIYFLNLVHLQKGEAIFQEAGIPHAYLEGQNVEIMANSDNVLRGGLTNKHIAVEELLHHINTEPVNPRIIHASIKNQHEVLYEVPVDEFSLGRLFLSKGEKASIQSTNTSIFLITEGNAIIRSSDHDLKIGAGKPSFIALPGTKFELEAETEIEVFRASVPGNY